MEIEGTNNVWDHNLETRQKKQEDDQDSGGLIEFGKISSSWELEIEDNSLKIGCNGKV
jgi:hypothetical protein